MTKTAMQHEVVNGEQWKAARVELLKKEKELTRLRDEIAKQRRDLPWEKVEKTYTFDGPKGKETLADLFGKQTQLIVYHFMFGPGWKEGCPSCSYLGDHFDGALPHLAARDVRLIAISRAPLAEIAEFKKRMGWKFPWYSSNETDFNLDYQVSQSQDEVGNAKVYYNYTMQEFPAEERPGASVFYKDAAGNVFHTYSTYGRGLDTFLGTYHWLDIAPKGRDEDELKFSMAWVRHHDKYGADYGIDVNAEYVQPAKK